MATSLRARKTLWIVFCIVLVDTLGVGILIPLIPLLFSDPSYAYHLPLDEDTGYLLLGALTALYPFMQFLFTPVLGQLSDTFGRKPVLAICLIGTAFSYVLFAAGILIRNIPLLFAARLLDGITGGNIAVAQAAVADVTSAEERVHSFGMLSAANGIGFILGPLFGAILSDPHLVKGFGAPTPFWFAAAFSLLNALAVFFILPETHKVRTKHKIRILQSFKNIKEAATGKAQRPLYITSFLFQNGFAFIITFFGVFLVSRFSATQADIGYLFAFVGAMLIATQVLVLGPLSRRVSPRTIIASALASMSAFLVCVYFTHSFPLLYVLTAGASICAGLILTNLTSLVSTSSKDKLQGSVLGINSSVQSVAQAIPPVFAGVIAAVFAPTTPVLFAAVIILAAGIFFAFHVMHMRIT